MRALVLAALLLAGCSAAVTPRADARRDASAERSASDVPTDLHRDLPVGQPDAIDGSLAPDAAVAPDARADGVLDAPDGAGDASADVDAGTCAAGFGELAPPTPGACDGFGLAECEDWAQRNAPGAVAFAACVSGQCRRADLRASTGTLHCGDDAECAPGQVCAADAPGATPHCRCATPLRASTFAPDGAASTCPDGSALCAGGCVDLATDRDHCGACGARCCALFNVCWSGRCVVAHPCPAGFTPCLTDGWCDLCRDLAHDPHNCGGCGIQCPSGQACSAGACVTVLDGAADATAVPDA